jgi:hypothetical protein
VEPAGCCFRNKKIETKEANFAIQQTQEGSSAGFGGIPRKTPKGFHASAWGDTSEAFNLKRLVKI